MKFQFILLHLLTSYKHNDHFLFIFLIKKKTKKKHPVFQKDPKFLYDKQAAGVTRNPTSD